MKELRIKDLSKRYGGVVALDKVSLNIPAGQLAAVLGPSGCGKTTLLRSIAGFEHPDDGSIEIDGVRIFGDDINVSPDKRFIGYVPQEGALFPHLNVKQNVAFGLPRKLKSSGRVSEILELVGMNMLSDRMPHELSGGQQQRVALARALAPSPTVVLMDEPFSALDAGLRAILREDVRTTLKVTGTTAIMVTHDQEEALSMADIIAVMRQGRVIQTTDPVSLYKFPADLSVAEFVGETTILQAKVCEDGCADCPFGRLSIAPSCPLETGHTATIMVRPEQFLIGKPDEGIHAQVIKVAYYGHDALVRLRLDDRFGGIEINARVLGKEMYFPGQQVGVKIDGDVMAYPVEKQVRT